MDEDQELLQEAEEALVDALRCLQNHFTPEQVIVLGRFVDAALTLKDAQFWASTEVEE